VMDYGNVEQLEGALTHLAQDPALRARLGANARCAYEEKYSWGIMQQRLVEVYASLSG
jgi:glycosyltransferase involved in cell wall biosynthesis